MSEIHYFQRYQQRENVVTNNTMLLFSRLYHYNTARFKNFLSELFDDPSLQPGIGFYQQIKSVKSVPDAMISQQSFKIVIETKLGGNPSVKQLTDHLQAFGNEDVRILLLVDRETPSDSFRKQVEDEIAVERPKVKFYSITFEKVIQSFNKCLQFDDVEMRGMVDDYEAFCIESNLLQLDQYRLRALASGDTYDLNMEFGIYYDPADRGYQPHKFIGLYRNKAIRGIGEIQNIIDANYINNQLIIVKADAKPTDDQKERIMKIIEVAKSLKGFDVSNNHKFFVVDRFFETEYIKITKNPIQRSKYFNLKDNTYFKDFSNPLNSESIAEALKGKHWDD